VAAKFPFEQHRRFGFRKRQARCQAGFERRL
jgi:hypothetical protein